MGNMICSRPIYKRKKKTRYYPITPSISNKCKNPPYINDWELIDHY